MRTADRKLVLADGSEYYGYGFGGREDRVCELVFDTSMVGYQEIVTDPAYADQAVLMTYPLIGNYGITDDDSESKAPALGALIVHDYHDMPSNFRATKSLAELLEENGIPGLYGLDTRQLTRALRDRGSCPALITDADTPLAQALETLRTTPLRRDAVARVSCKKRWYARTANHVCHVVAIDCGIRLSSIRCLNRLGCNVTVVPYDTVPADIAFMKPDGIFLSDGPGDPADVPAVAETIRALRGTVPMFGVGLGHQLLALSYGAKASKLPVGHRGANHAVRCLTTGRLETVAQNHGYAVDEASLVGTGLTVTHRDLMDSTVEGLACPADRAFSAQYHPESVFDPQNADDLFVRFRDLMKEAKTNA